MEKSKKIIKRVSVFIVAALVLFVSFGSALIPDANALAVLPGADENGNYFSFGTPGSMLVPLTEFMHHTDCVTVENPLYMVCVNEDSSIGYSSSIDYTMYNYLGASQYTWEFWNLGLNQSSRTEDGIYLAKFGLKKMARGNSFHFAMRTGDGEFIIRLSDLNYFLRNTVLYLPQYFEVKQEVIIEFQYAYNDNGSVKFAIFSKTLSNTNSNYDSDGEVGMSLPTISAEDVSEYISDNTMVIVKHLSINYRVFADLEYSSLTDISCSRMFRFVTLVSAYDFTCNYTDFYALYKVDINTVPGSGSFNLATFLRSCVGDFFQLEIIPNVSIGLIFSVIIGILLVAVLVKRLG